MDDRIKVLKAMVKNLEMWKERNYNLILLVIYFIFTTVQIYCHEYYTANTWFIMSAGIAIVICLMGYTHEQISKTKNKKFPVFSKRMTIRMDDGVYVNKDDWEKAIMYLADIEDYLERQGLIR